MNHADNDGWTPLCWAARPFKEESLCEKLRSEKPDWAEVIRILLKHGADRTVRCRLGVEKDVEMLSPLDSSKAMQCGAGDHITTGARA